MRLKLDIEQTLETLLQQEDTDGDKRITIEDKGPQIYVLKDLNGTNQEVVVKGTYQLSNLLQELILAKEKKDLFIETNNEYYYWDGLTRTIDKEGLHQILTDEKSSSSKQRIYVPFKDTQAFDYYKALENTMPHLKVVKLPKEITPEYVLKNINGELKGVPFAVPGGRFNEMYGWDSYFESIGLLLGPKKELAKSMADNFQYEVEHYGKILNANRTYYLTRTQPPFYSSLIREVLEHKVKGADLHWLKSHMSTAIKEYETVWMVQGSRLTDNGLRLAS